MTKSFVTPDWPAPKNIHAYTTTRWGGVSPSPYASMNLSVGSGDTKDNVQQNKKQLVQNFNLPSEPIWLNQVNGTQIIDAAIAPQTPEADASYTGQKNTVCIILTADCLPVLICNRKGTHVAAVHAGWRGLAHGIIEKTLQQLNLPPNDVLAWLGPGISAENYIVGSEVKTIFEQNDSQAKTAFTSLPEDKWRCDLYKIARQRLFNCDVNQVVGGDFCTFRDSDNFYSHRRDKPTGRMASFIWME